MVRERNPTTPFGHHLAALAVDCRCTLGEGIVWCPTRQLFWWTDIENSRLWMHSPEGGKTRYWDLPQRLGCLALCESGKLLLGLAKGLSLAEVNPDSDEPPRLTLLVPVEEDEPRTRINDGRCDRAGNFIFGTMNEAPAREPIGSLYQYSSRGLRRLDLGGFVIPNSLCFSPDGGTLYYCDSLQPRILCCDYDADSARTQNTRIITTLSQSGSCADGSTIDAEGHLWNAQWGAARVVRYTPQGGIDRVVALATRNPSCLAFGGAALDQLYITTARFGLATEDLYRSQAAGGLYRWHSTVRGLPESVVGFL